MLVLLIINYGELIESENKAIIKAKVNIRDDEIVLAINEVKPIQEVNLVKIKCIEPLKLEENVLLKELLAKHKGENPVVIDFPSVDEFNNPQRYQLLTSNHLWVNVSDPIKQELEATFKDKMEVTVQAIG